jgi:hypothetical protein
VEGGQGPDGVPSDVVVPISYVALGLRKLRRNGALLSGRHITELTT